MQRLIAVKRTNGVYSVRMGWAGLIEAGEGNRYSPKEIEIEIVAATRRGKLLDVYQRGGVATLTTELA